MGTRLIQKQARIARQDEELAALRSVANLAPTSRTTSDTNSNREQVEYTSYWPLFISVVFYIEIFKIVQTMKTCTLTQMHIHTSWDVGSK